jgi:hypothetical protein
MLYNIYIWTDSSGWHLCIRIQKNKIICINQHLSFSSTYMSPSNVQSVSHSIIQSEIPSPKIMLDFILRTVQREKRFLKQDMWPEFLHFPLLIIKSSHIKCDPRLIQITLPKVFPSKNCCTDIIHIPYGYAAVDVTRNSNWHYAERTVARCL